MNITVFFCIKSRYFANDRPTKGKGGVATGKTNFFKLWTVSVVENYFHFYDSFKLNNPSLPHF